VSAPGDVTVVWVAPDGGPSAGARSGPGDGRDDATRAVLEWARARGLHVRPATDGARGGLEHVDFTIAERVEKELDRAREAIAALDADVAERALARAETLLREHPELPQAAWLRAEVHRSWAARWTRVEPRDDHRAQEAWQDAEALDGGRAAGIGEVAFPSRPRTAATLSVQGAASRSLVARLDGTELTATTGPGGSTTYALDVPAAEHQIVVSVDGETVFASWVAIAEAAHAGASAPTPMVVSVRVSNDGACAASSFGGVSADGAGGVRASGVSCDQWLAAMPTDRAGAVLIARCERNACGPFLEWRAAGGLEATATAAPPQVRRGGAWPAWATWTALGVGAVAATTITLIATGVFESRPTEQRFVAGGVRQE
jgi:hypothetical protein